MEGKYLINTDTPAASKSLLIVALVFWITKFLPDLIGCHTQLYAARVSK